MSATGLEPDELLELLYTDLTPFVEAGKGKLVVASDPWNFLELLAEAPSGWRAALHWDGDDNTMDRPLNGRLLVNNFSVGVTCQKGLTIKPEESLFRPRPGNAPSLLKLVSMVRAHVCGYVFPAEVSEQYVFYRGTEPLVLPDRTPLSGFRLRFAITATPENVIYRE